MLPLAEIARRRAPPSTRLAQPGGRRGRRRLGDRPRRRPVASLQRDARVRRPPGRRPARRAVPALRARRRCARSATWRPPRGCSRPGPPGTGGRSHPCRRPRAGSSRRCRRRWATCTPPPSTRLRATSWSSADLTATLASHWGAALARLHRDAPSADRRRGAAAARPRSTRACVRGRPCRAARRPGGAGGGGPADAAERHPARGLRARQPALGRRAPHRVRRRRGADRSVRPGHRRRGPRPGR